MHMADALLSPAVGGTMWAVSAGAIAFSSARLGKEADDRKVPLMGVLGAFLFAAQMINFSIPGTGSSGHLGGGLLLSVLLGPGPALLTIASVLVVQALFFADGGLLALGCNIFNLGIIPALFMYPLVYRKLIGRHPGPSRLTAVTLFCAVIGLQLGAFAVVLETVCSGVSALPFSKFLVLMQPIHLAIGVMEGAVTAAVIGFIRQARPGMLSFAEPAGKGRSVSAGVLLAFLICAFLTAGGLSWFACKDPDGLEWAVARIAGPAGVPQAQARVLQTLSRMQEKSALFPDYQVGKGSGSRTMSGEGDHHSAPPGNSGTGIAGLAGTLLTLLLVFVPSFLISKLKRARA